MDKNKIIIILAVSVVLFLALSIGSCVNAYNQNAGRKKEMLQRMDLEEKISRLNQERAKELDATKKELTREQMMSQSLKEELQKMTKLKEDLEEKLNKESTANKKGQK